MATYAPVPAFAERKRHPQALLLIVAGHAALLAVVITAKMDLPQKLAPTETDVTFVPLPKEPPPVLPEPQPQQQTKPQPSQSAIDRPVAIVPIPADPSPPLDTSPVPLRDPGPTIGPSPTPSVDPKPAPIPLPVRTGPRFATPADDVRPPYPEQKRRTDEEAALKLRLSIDARGRVVAVEPVGRADRAFLDAARRHILARWRYKPAMEDGRAVASSTVITLRFELDD